MVKQELVLLSLKIIELEQKTPHSGVFIIINETFLCYADVSLLNSA